MHSRFNHYQPIGRAPAVVYTATEGRNEPSPFCYRIKAVLLTAALFDAVLSTETGFRWHDIRTRAAFIE